MSKGKHPEVVKKMSYSQMKRAKMPDYRAVYFSHNPGLFGMIWFCSYCHRVIVGKHNVEVDHIMPLNSRLGMNKGFNLTASCKECNRDKSDKVDYRVPKGYFNKILSSLIFGVQKVAIIAFVAVYSGILALCRMLFKLLSAPYHSGSWKLVVIATIAYVIGFYVIFKMVF